MKTLATAMLAVTAMAAMTASAHAQTAQCTVTEILATNDKKGVDPKLDRFKAKLTKPPMTAFDSFAFLGEQAVSPEKQKPVQAKLVNGNLTILFKDKLVETDGKPRLRISLEHDGKDGTRLVSTVVSFDSGDNVILGGKPYEKGTYFVALGCTAN